jgi:hypothetical protein
MTWARQRGVVLTLALLALALKVVVPPGFMVGPPTNSLPFAIVICTAQGAVVVDPGGSHEDGEASKHDAPCVFAGHGLGAEPPERSSHLLRPTTIYHPIALTPSCEAAPGRGLCAPPPPARGPPLSI